MSRSELFTDGGSRGNPGAAAYGFMILTANEITAIDAGFCGDKVTNNVAEYEGLLYGLQEVCRLGISEVNIYMDSELIVKQLKGEYKVKNSDMRKYFDQVQSLLSDLDWHISHIPRARNHVADRLVNIVLDARAK